MYKVKWGANETGIILRSVHESLVIRSIGTFGEHIMGGDLCSGRENEDTSTIIAAFGVTLTLHCTHTQSQLYSYLLDWIGLSIDWIGHQI